MKAKLQYDWIPCDEILPEDDMNVLVIARDVECETNYITTAYLSGRRKTHPIWISWERKTEMSDEVLCWTPEPKIEEEEK